LYIFLLTSGFKFGYIASHLRIKARDFLKPKFRIVLPNPHLFNARNEQKILKYKRVVFTEMARKGE